MRAQKIAVAKGGGRMLHSDHDDASIYLAGNGKDRIGSQENHRGRDRRYICCARNPWPYFRRLAKYEPFNTIELRQQIAQKVIERGKYTLA